MKNIFYFFILLPFATFAQSTSMQLLNSNDTTLCAGNAVTLTSQLINAPLGTESYSIATIPFNMESTASATSITLLDDDQTNLLPIGFNFCFYGQSYTQFIISSNGWVGFSSNQPNTWASATLPNTSGDVPYNCIMLPWQDLDPRFGGTISYEVKGIAPYRYLLVSYESVPLYTSGSNGCGVVFTGQAKLYETTNIIETHLLEKSVCMTWNGGAAIHGLHNSNGTLATPVPGRNNATWTVGSEGTQFKPNGVLNSTINWYCGSLLIGTGNAVTISPLASCQYTITATAGCGNMQVINDTINVNVSTIQQQVAVIKGVQCYNYSNAIVTSYANGGIGTLQYSWNTSPIQTMATATNLPSGIYTCTVTDMVGCSQSSAITLVNPPLLNIFTNGIQMPTCWNTADGKVDIKVDGGAQPYAYTWSNASLNEDLKNATSAIYTVIVRDANSCYDTMEVNLHVPELKVKASDDKIINFGTACDLNAIATNTNGLAIEYSWLPTNQLNNSHSAATNCTANVTTTYTVTATNSNGCKATDDVIVQVIYGNNFPIYNAFSPNNDGENDQFTLSPFSEYLRLKQLLIFNRWGEKVFETKDIKQGWDGTFKGQPAEIGSYVYEASVNDANGGVHLLKGSVSLIR